LGFCRRSSLALDASGRDIARMHFRRSFLLPSLIMATIGVGRCIAAVPSQGPAGYWEGAVTLPAGALEIKVDLAQGSDQAWHGTIDIPRQGFRDFQLTNITVAGADVAFGMATIPGEPRFAGKLLDDGKTIAGEFTQGTGKVPFKIERKPRPPKVARKEMPTRGIPGKGLAGNWLGAIKPVPGIELRLALELTEQTAGKPEGVAISLDQGNARVPITTLTATNGAVHFETASIGGVFDGKFNADGSEIRGDWSQGGRTSPLVFLRMAKGATAGSKSR
jgi:hypothetical protein